MLLLTAILILTISSFFLNRKIKKMRFLQNGNNSARFSSLTVHYVYCFVLWLAIFFLVIIFSDLAQFKKYLFLILFTIAIFFLVIYFYRKNFSPKNHLEWLLKLAMSITALIGIFITIAITISILFESIRFFEIVNIWQFLFGLKWNPQIAIHAEQAVSESAFGIIPVLLGTLLITFVAMLIAIPFGIMAAIYLAFYARKKTRDYLKPMLEILAGIPTVVYGYFAVIAVAPFFKNSFALIGMDIAAESALAAGFVMGIMIIPFILSLVDDALNAVPRYLKDGSLALGSTKSEMIKKVALPSAMPSIVGAVILAFSRAIGETMIVVMAAGLVANLTFNPLDSVTTATAQIVSLLVGDQEFNSPKTLAAFALALVLFVITFIFNVIALLVMKKYKK